VLNWMLLNAIGQETAFLEDDNREIDRIQMHQFFLFPVIFPPGHSTLQSFHYAFARSLAYTTL
jgi:hypothetical protein